MKTHGYSVLMTSVDYERIKLARRYQRALHGIDTKEPLTMNLARTARKAMAAHCDAVIEHAKSLGIDLADW